VIQAAVAGDVDTMKILLAGGCNLTEVGHICLSRRRGNSVASNVIGAAAYHGNRKMLHFLLGKVEPGCIDIKAIETADVGKASTFKHEVQSFTPLQLALVSPKSHVDIVKLLFGKGDCNHQALEASTGNNILHMAAKNCTPDSIAVLEYVVKNARLDIF